MTYPLHTPPGMLDRYAEARDQYPVLEYRLPVLESGLGLHTPNSIMRDIRSRLSTLDEQGYAAERADDVAYYANNVAMRIVDAGMRLFGVAPEELVLTGAPDLPTAPLQRSLLQQMPGTVLTRAQLARTYAEGHMVMLYELFSLNDPETMTEHATGVVMHFNEHDYVGGLRVHNQAIHRTPEGDRRELSFVEHYYLSSNAPSPSDVDFVLIAEHIQQFLDADGYTLDWESSYSENLDAALAGGVPPVLGAAPGLLDATDPTPSS